VTTDRVRLRGRRSWIPARGRYAAVAGTRNLARVEMPQDIVVDGAERGVVTSARILDQHRPIRAGVDALYSIGQVIRGLLDPVPEPVP
jgi:hypothetical protein